MSIKNVLFIMLLAFATDSVFGQTNPAARCKEMWAFGIEGTVCTDCQNYATCTGGVVGSTSTSCTSGQICDAGVVDGTCVTPVSSSLSPICYCAEVGCYKDPNDQSSYVHCTGSNSVGGIAPSTPCDYTSEQFKMDSCECEQALCPSCRSLAADTSACSNDFYYCDSPAAVGPFSCGDGQCFLHVDAGCGCFDKSAVIDGICPSCGFIKGANCPNYYGCTNDGTITGSFSCSVDQCFEQATCQCV